MRLCYPHKLGEGYKHVALARRLCSLLPVSNYVEQQIYDRERQSKYDMILL